MISRSDGADRMIGTDSVPADSRMVGELVELPDAVLKANLALGAASLSRIV